MTRDERPEFPSNLLSERYLCIEWAYDSGLIKKLAETHPLYRINRMTVRQYLDRAIGYLVQSGVPLRAIWEVADLVTPDAFKKILDAALATSPASAVCMSLVLLTTAREWVGVDEGDLRRLEELVRDLPGVAENRRLALATRRPAQFPSELVSGTPARLRRPA